MADVEADAGGTNPSLLNVSMYVSTTCLEAFSSCLAAWPANARYNMPNPFSFCWESSFRFWKHASGEIVAKFVPALSSSLDQSFVRSVPNLAPLERAS